MSDIRIKDLASADGQLDKFDDFEFIADVPDVDSSMKISGKQMREKMTPTAHTHKISEVTGLQDALDKKFNKSGGSVSGNFAVLGNTRLRNLAVEEFLEVPEFRYNRIETTVGDKWSAAGAGIIESVDTENRILIMKLESGEISSLRLNDLCKGIFYNVAVNNYTETTVDSDDSKGNITHAGFTTVYFKLVECLNTTTYGEWKYELREGYAYHPQPAMNIVAYANPTDISRQTSRYETRTYQRYLVGMTDWEISLENIAAQFGDLSNLYVHGLNMEGYSAYLKNIYLQGFISDLVGDSWFNSTTGEAQLYDRTTGCGLSFKDGILRIGRIDPTDPTEGTDLEVLLEDLQETRDTLEMINSDEYVSPVEKTYLKERLADIHAEYAHLLDQATVYLLKSGNRAANGRVRIVNGVVRTVNITDESWREYITAYTLAVTALEKYTATSPEYIVIGDDFDDIDAYYSARAAVETMLQEKMKEALKADQNQTDLEYLRENFAESTTDIDGQSGVVLSGFVGVKDESDTKVVAAMAGCTLPDAVDAEHGKLMLFAGADGVANAKNANARIYQDGHVEFSSGVFGGYTRVLFKDLDEDGTTFNSSTREYTVNKNLNLVVTYGYFSGAYMVTINLPTSADYIGSVVNLYDYPVRTKSSPEIYVVCNDEYCGIMSELQTNSYGFIPFKSLWFHGGIVQFLGVPSQSGDKCAWLVMSHLAAAYALGETF